MNSQSLSNFSEAELLNQVQIALKTRNYQQLTIIYENLINLELNNYSYYWYLGLFLLLQGLTVEAQTTWLMAMIDGEPSQVEVWTAELVEILETEANHQDTKKDISLVWLIRQQIRELLPTAIDNLLYLCFLSIELQTYTTSELEDLGIIELLESQPNLEVSTTTLLINLVRAVLNYAPLYDSSLKLVEIAAPCIKGEEQKSLFLGVIESSMAEIGVARGYYAVAIPLGEIGISVNPQFVGILFHLTNFYQNIGKFDEGIKFACQVYPLLSSLPDQIYGKILIVRGFMGASSYWQEASNANDEAKELITTLLTEGEIIGENKLGALASSTFFLPYFKDQPRDIRKFHNQMAELCCVNIRRYYQQLITNFQELHEQRKARNQDSIKIDQPLRIGYISHCFKTHSVGWLARWIFEHADLEKFEIYTYMACCDPVNNPLHEWYLNKIPKYFKSNIVLELAEKIS